NPFIVNESRLKNNFRRVQRCVHPDLWATQGKARNTTNELLTQVARDLSSLVNDAYITLHQPLSRIHYILSQHNLGILETDQLDGPHLITEVIEIREALEDASTESEVMTSRKTLKDNNGDIEHAVHVEDGGGTSWGSAT
ncbi:hypothetical protein EDB85DRAFT_2191405, partial [Lactarius pseudohatsudake]